MDTRSLGLVLVMVALSMSSTGSAQRTVAIPLVVHDAGHPDGGQLARDTYLDVVIETANRWFEPANVCFFLSARHSLRPGLRDVEGHMPATAAVRVGVVRSLVRDGESLRGVGGKRGANRYVVMDRYDAGRLTLAHELGHALGLEHEEDGVMQAPTDWWGKAAGMTAAQQEIARRNALDFERDHGRFPNARCVRASIPRRQDVSSGSPLLIETSQDEREGVYEGELLFGKRHGEGRLAYRNGDYYEGDWCEGRRTGHGVYRSRSGAVYEGELLSNEKHGRGRHSYSNGDRYEGDWRHGARTGQGTYRWRNGGVYEGQWQNARRVGQGTMRYNDGSRYDGSWRNNRRHGQGVLVYTDGDRFEGPFVRGERHGTGAYHFASGSWLEGRWSRGRRVETTRRGSRRVRTRVEQRIRPTSDLSSSPQTCSGGEGVRVGDRVRLGAHRQVAGSYNWSSPMDDYVGQLARVGSVGRRDQSGCRVIRVDIDGGRYSWRARDVRRVPRARRRRSARQTRRQVDQARRIIRAFSPRGLTRGGGSIF